ncbi:MAG: imidazole glycerol phosphate synthase subunit HisH [Chloroflexota bacterium]|nr:imidazole glycerol phosphate synthase subunit HisH [Chloroflexota bacterium]
MIAIIDYGMGNLRSVQKAFEKIGATARIVPFPRDIENARGIVLPGVGAFGQAMDNLRAIGWVEPLRDACARGVPFIGICLGLQLLFESSEEMGQHEGLGILRGEVKRFNGELKVPQMGWNQIHIKAKQRSPLLRDVADGSYAFFVHSYYCAPRDLGVVLATTDYGIEFASVVGRASIFGAQFHPEKSQSVGLKMLENFAAMAR